MHTFFFGESKRKLYGAFSPPVAGRGGGAPVLLCYPFGQEHIRAHMAFRQLGNLLSRGGRGVLRFDFFGTGDSAGSLAEADLSIWSQNVETALDELKALTGATHVSVVGLRLGALVAAGVVEARRDVEALVLWDPVLDGPRFLTEMEEQKTGEVGDEWWVNGFPLSGKFRKSLEGADLLNIQVPDEVSVLHLHSGGETSGRGGSIVPFPERWTKRGGGWKEEVTGDPGDWNYLDEEGAILLPHETVKAASLWLKGTGRTS